MLTLALSTWSYHRRLRYFGSGSWSPQTEIPQLSILDFPAIAANLGIHQAEICQAHLETTDRAYLDRVRSALDAAGVAVVNVPIDVGNLAAAEQATRDADIAEITDWIDAAHYLGSPNARVNTGHAEGMSEENAVEAVADGYRRLADHCAPLGMNILIENHGGLSSSPTAIISLVEKVDRENFRLCPDFGNFAAADREAGLRRMLPRAAVVHAKVMDMDESGVHSAFDLDRCLQLVEESGYAGPVSIEFEGGSDQQQGVECAVAILRPWIDRVNAAAGSQS
jgi:L-ribulose-5-phosphate 3-epimerase